ALLEHPAALKARRQPPPAACLFRRECARVYARARDRVADRRIAGDHHVVRDRQVPGEADRAADHAALADGGAPRHAGAAGDDGVRADAHVVGDHDEVVELHALLDDRVVDGAAVNGRVAPISTSAPMRTLPTCGTLTQLPRSGAKPKPSPPITTPGCSTLRAPTWTPRPRLTRATRRTSAPTVTP